MQPRRKKKAPAFDELKSRFGTTRKRDTKGGCFSCLGWEQAVTRSCFHIIQEGPTGGPTSGALYFPFLFFSNQELENSLVIVNLI